MQTVNLTKILPYYKKFEYNLKKMIEISPRTVFLYLLKNSSSHSIKPRIMHTARIAMYNEYSRPLIRKC